MVITGGGAQLRHVGQLFEYVTGMDTRIGYPNEYLAKGNAEEVTSPMFATSVGLVLKGFQRLDKQKNRINKQNEVTPDVGTVRQGDKIKGGFFQSILSLSLIHI